jgi:hypothetical protein
MVSATVVGKSREIDVSGQRDEPGKCHHSRPMVDSAPDLRRLASVGIFFSTRTRSFAESPTSEEPCESWKKLPLNYRRLSFIQTLRDLSISYYHAIHHVSTGMPEANGYYCQCIDLTTRKHTPPDKRGICRKDARHSTSHQGAYLRARAQPKQRAAK